MEQRKFFACSVGEPGKDYVEDNLNRIISNKAFILHGEAIQKGVYDNITSGDILLLKYNNQFIAFGETKGKTTSEDDEWNLWAPVHEWVFKNSKNTREGVPIYGIGWSTESGGPYGTVKEISQDFSLGKMKEIDGGSKMYIELMKEIQSQQNIKNMQEIINLLEYKKQIILQGPPGTGKTRMAKIIADKMTKPQKQGSPIQQINDFFKHFDSSTPEVKEKRGHLNKLLDEFHKKFPVEKLKSLTLRDYCVGTGTNDSFCWWIETGLRPLGYYSPGSARSYLLYWSKKKEVYSKHGKLLEGIDDNEKAMEKLASFISTFIETKNFDFSSHFVGESLLLKLLHTYFPEEYAPVNGVPSLNNALKLFGIDYSNMDPIEKNLKLQEIFNQKKKQFNVDVTNLEFMRFLFEKFDLKGDISVQSNEIVSQGEYKIIQFHPAYSYEDFVRGIAAKANAENQIEYKVENRILAQFAEKALNNKSKTYILIIDEINRSNLPSVLGELIYALEYRFDENHPKETTVESLYALKDDDEPEKEESKELKLPPNLYIIGTMNTADRSVGHIDYAIRRRFAFIDILPTDIAIDEEIKDPELNRKAKELFEKVSALFYEKKDSNDHKPVYLQADFKARDVQLGHSYFLVANEEQLRLKLKYEIKPILTEYIKDGILNEAAINEINKL